MNKDISKKLNKEQLRELICINLDARQYFYAKADERWLDWLWQNGFLDAIKEKLEDPPHYGDAPPELNCLVRMAEKAPAKVVDIMLQVPIAPETFNPVVVDRFLAICRKLPADQLARVVEKIRDERWIPLVSSAYRLHGFECQKMFKTLADAKNYQSLLVLAEAVLTLRIQEEKAPSHFRSTPFYFDKLSPTKIFQRLSHVDPEYREPTLGLAAKVMADVIAEQALGDDEESEKIFKIDDCRLFYNVDFFDCESGWTDRLPLEDDVRELATVIKVLAEKLIGDRCDNPQAVRGVYEKMIGDFDNPDATLPDSQAMWRLRLFVLSLCPEAFKDKLKKAFFRLFEVEQYHEIIHGTEYQKALQKGFAALSEKDRRHYVNQVMEYFTQQDREEENWHLCNGSHVLSMIASQLTEKEKGHAKKAGFILDPNYQPEPSIGRPRVGYVVPRGPITEEEFGKLSIAGIAEKLRNEWTPNELAKQNTVDHFLSPLNADGVSQLLKKDIPKRLQEYVRTAENFFERGVLDEHYTYSFLNGIQKTIQAHGETASTVHWDGVIDLCMTIQASGENDPFEREARKRNSFDTWLANWNAVHFAMTEVMQAFLTEKNGVTPIDFGKYRDRIFGIVSYVLSYPDPVPEDEQLETAKSKTKSSGDRVFEAVSNEVSYGTKDAPARDAGYKVSDPFHMAVNAVRGQGFATLTLFVDQDGKKFKTGDAVKIADDVKALYERVLGKEATRALMFMFGHYLPIFYFRDREWIRGILPQLFSQEPAKQSLYTAAWEGYLFNNLYEEMFFDPEIQKLYERGLALTNANYPPQQKHFKEPDECIAEHLALAFMHYKRFDLDHPLFDVFWKKNDPEMQATFVDFLGREFVSGNNANAHALLEKKPESKKRLKIFWDWLLKNVRNPNATPFMKFDSWINLENGIFEPAWLAERIRKTLEHTRGRVDSDHKLTKSIVRLAEANTGDTLEIARWYLLEGKVWNGDQPTLLLYPDDWTQWKNALKILHDNQGTKSGTSALINKLILEGGRPFWDLKEIVNDNIENHLFDTPKVT